MKKLVWIIAALTAVLLLGGFGVLYGTSPFAKQESVKVHIAANMTGREIADLLKSRGVIYDANIFRGALYLSQSGKMLREGDYEFRTHMPIMHAIDKLKHGRMKMIRVVIPEGFRVEQIAKRMEEMGICREADFMAAARVFSPDEEIKSKRPVDVAAEGFLFPETYEFTANTSPETVLQVMYEEWKKHMTPEVRKEIAARHMSIHEFMTLASLVEKEALFPTDRGLIAAVFKKRLAMNMPLQSCASIQYVLGEVKPFLSIADTQIPSPYNTYLHEGLPPGPIASPGEAAMKAVLDSPKTDFLFFVADKDGHHLFAKTYEEHEANIQRVYGNE